MVIGTVTLFFAACGDDCGSSMSSGNGAELAETSSSSKVISSSREKKTSSSSTSEPKSSFSVSKTVLSLSDEKTFVC